MIIFRGIHLAPQKHFSAAELPAIIFVPAFGDDRSVYEPLLDTKLTGRYRLVLFDLPGFGRLPRLEGPTTLENLADVVHEKAVAEQARIVVGHSLASIMGFLAQTADLLH